MNKDTITLRGEGEIEGKLPICAATCYANGWSPWKAEITERGRVTICAADAETGEYVRLGVSMRGKGGVRLYRY